MVNEIMTYEEFLKSKVKYHNVKCMVYDCKKEGSYEGGDSRCWCPMCEEHADMEREYRFYLEKFKVKLARDISTVCAYLSAINKQYELQNKLAKALEEEYGPKLGEIKPNIP